jgi:hypothetical protein
VLERVAASPYGFALVLGPAGVLLGRVRRSTLATTPAAERIEPIIEPGPSTIRPHLTSDELYQPLERAGVRTLVVTTPGGVLLGVVRRDAPASAAPRSALVLAARARARHGALTALALDGLARSE